MQRALTSDELGKVGQSYFDQLCTTDGLIPNPSTWDRKGWDFTVDWRFAPEKIDYDSRPTPLSCLVQVKTVWDDTSSVSLSLSAIEHIAKDVKPVFIVAHRYAPDASPLETKIAHVDGALLGHVLKALRKARADDKKLNQVEISLALNTWFEIVPGGRGNLRAAFESAIGPSMEKYVARKQENLRELGFEHGRLSLHTTLRAQDMDALTDAFLGLVPIEAVGLTASEDRFGIALPLPELSHDAATLNISPRPHDTCKIIATTPDGSKSFHFKGDVFGVPRAIAADHLKLLIRSELFALVIRGEKLKRGHNDFKLNLTVERDKMRKARMRPKDWSALYGFLHALTQDRLHINITAKKAGSPLSGHIKLDLEPGGDDDFVYAATLMRTAADICDHAEWPGAKLKIDDIAAVSRELTTLERLINAPDTLKPFSFTTDGDGPTEGQFDLVYYDFIGFGDHALAFAAVGTFVAHQSDDATHWKSGPLRFLDIRRIRARAADYDKFIAKVERLTGIENRYVAKFIAGKG